MPIYEYSCLECEKVFQVLIMNSSDMEELVCPDCGRRNVQRLISRVTYHMSEADRLNGFDAKSRQSEGFYTDSRNIGLHAQKRAKQMGVDLGEGFREKVEKLRTDPGSVIKDTE